MIIKMHKDNETLNLSVDVEYSAEEVITNVLCVENNKCEHVLIATWDCIIIED